ncbi:MAG TPA: hypothetical protein VGT44_23055, partial [Ktedonobacteraceae bacterium]|nr:hypothetical protein [Ktedonobacteraceae bacterium]
MNTHRFIPSAHHGMGRFALSLCGGLLLALSLLLPPTASAAAPSAPSLSSANVLNLAGVSVVRLSMTYISSKGIKITCTALGTLIASWPASSNNDANNWVVTDSTALSLTGGTGKCAPVGDTLATIQILANNLYTSATNPNTTQATLDTLQCGKTTCQDQTSESLSSTAIGGGVLFSFHTDGLNMQPFLDTGIGQPSLSTSVGIELANQSKVGAWPPKPQLTDALQALTFLTPVDAISNAPSLTPGATPSSAPAPGNNVTSFEPGMPLVDAQGAFIGMKVSNSTTLFTVSNLKTLEMAFSTLQSQKSLEANNILKVQWNNGIQQFDQNSFLAAKNDFDTILDHTKVNNPQFQAANTFSQQAAAKLPHPTGSPTTAGSPTTGQGQGGSGLGLFGSTLLMIGLGAGLILLVLLLILVSLVFGRRRALRKKNQEEMDRFKEEAAAARRNAP